MQAGIQEFIIDGFQGVRNWELDSRIPKTNLWDVLNSDFEGGVWKSSKGVTEYLTALVGGTNTKGLFYYPYTNTAGVNSNYLIQYYNGQIYRIDTDTDTRTTIADTWTVDEDIGGVVYNNELYLVSPNNGMAYITTGNTWGNTFVGTPPPGTMIETNAEKLWVAGVTAAPSVIFYSRTANAATPTNIRDWTTGAGSVLVGKGGRITALKNLKNTLYVFKTDSIYYLSSFDTSGVSPVPLFSIYAVTSGAINKNCVTQVENDLWFLTPELQVRSLGSVAQYISDTRTTDVSLAIKKFIRYLDPDQSQASMSYFNNVLEISFKTAGSAAPNISFVYNFNDAAWSIKRLASIKTSVSTPTQKFFCEAGTSGKLYKADSGYTKNGATYAWNGKTLMIDLGAPYLNKRCRYVKIHCGRSENHAITMCVYKNSYDETPLLCKTLEAPTTSEMGITSTTDDGQWGDIVGGAVWGGLGEANPSTEPPIYKKVFKVDVNQTGRQFGIDLSSTIYGGRIEIYQIVLGLIPLPDKNLPVTN